MAAPGPADPDAAETSATRTSGETDDVRGGRGRGDGGDATSPPSLGDRYRLMEELGRGAYGVVWLARDLALDRLVAVKVLDERHPSGEPQDRLVEEARAMARLSHPNVVTVHDVGVRGGRVYVAMELVDGVPLSRWLKTPRAWPEVVRVFRDVAAGLAAAHAAGLVHRDIKPSNILLGSDGRPRIADFGVAHARHEPSPAVTATTTAGPIGTPAYMPPERLIGDPAAARGDQFSFCATFYEALHGRRPFPGKSTVEIAVAIAAGVPAPVRPVPSWLNAVIARGLARDPADRFASMDELAAALERPRRERRWPRTLATVAAALFIAGLGAATTWWFLHDRATTSPPRGEPAALAAVAPAPDAATATATATDAVDAAAAARPDAAATPAAPAVIDAATSAPTSSPPRTRPPRRDPAAGLDFEEVRIRYRALRNDYLAAARAGELARARSLARQAGPFADRLGDGEPYSVEMAMSCRLGDEAGARAAFRKLPRPNGILTQFHYDAVNHCKRNGINIQDLLDAPARAPAPPR